MPISNPNINSISFPSPELLIATAIDATINATTSVEILSQNAGRRGLTIFNAHSHTVYIDTVSHNNTSTFMLALASGAYYEMPSPALHNALYAIASLGSGSGKLLIREINVSLPISPE